MNNSSLPPIPDWLKPTLRRPIAGQPEPDTMDLQVVVAALAGVERKALCKRFDLASEEILKSILRVAGAVRESKLDSKALDQYPELRVLKSKREAKRAKRSKPDLKAEERTMALATLAVAMDDSDLPAIVPGNDESFHKFLMAVKVKHASTLVPDTIRSLHAGVLLGDNESISKSLEMYYGVGRRGPGVAIQQNFGGKPTEEAEETPHFFEETILTAEKEEGGSGGETTVFDERLLGQQEES